MVSSLGSGLLAASMLLGQVTEIQVSPPPTTGTTTNGRTPFFGGNNSSTQQQQRPLFPWFSRDDRPRTSRFQSWFGRKEQQQQEPPLGTTPFIQQRGGVIIEGTPTSNPGVVVPTTPTPLDYPKKMPSPSSQASPAKEYLAAAAPMPSKSVQQTNMQVPPSNGKILPQLVNKIGRDERFEWITGQLEVENGMYMIFYATPDTVDTYHGRIAVNPQKIDMSTFRRSDLVSVRGNLMQRQTPQGMIPIYRATDMQLIERVK